MRGALRGQRRIHLVGIGGAGLSAMAEILMTWGADVSGSDRESSPRLKRLQAHGARIVLGHQPANLGDAGAVVVSRAIADDNSEVVAAHHAGVPVLSRTEALVEMLEGMRVLSITGTHGKSSTTAMVALILEAAGWAPGFLVGADLVGADSNGCAGGGEVMVVEADESDGTFVALRSEAGIVTSVEPDHLDHFGDVDNMRADFASFAAALSGPAVVCRDDPFLATLSGTITYGTGDDARYRMAAIEPRDWGSDVRIDTPQGPLEFRLAVPGAHFALNATGAAALALELRAPPPAVVGGLASFRGLRRRFERLGEARDVMVVDDYAHLPAEVAATVATAVSRMSRVVAVFQPHLYSRTEALWRDFGPAFAGAAVVVVTDVYAAREEPRPGVTGELVARSVAEALPGVHVVYEPDRAALARLTAVLCLPGDLVLTMGAGDVTAVGPQLLEILSGGRP